MQFNADAQKQRTKEALDKSMEQIKANMEKGTPITELYIDKDIALEVRDLIDTAIERLGMQNQFYWAVVRTGTNPHTGRTDHFTGMVIGEHRYYKLVYRT